MQPYCTPIDAPQKCAYICVIRKKNAACQHKFFSAMRTCAPPPGPRLFTTTTSLKIIERDCAAAGSQIRRKLIPKLFEKVAEISTRRFHQLGAVVSVKKPFFEISFAFQTVKIDPTSTV